MPHVIIMVGIPGAGKTQFAEHFAKTFNAPFLNQEVIAAIAQTNQVTTASLMDYLLTELLKTDRTIIFEGQTQQQLQRSELLKKIHKAGYHSLLVWVQTETSEAMHRSLKNKKIASADEYEHLLHNFNPPHSSEKAVVISGKHTYASQVKGVLKRLSEQRQAQSASMPPRPSSSTYRPRKIQ